MQISYNKYLEKHALYPPLIKDKPSSHLKHIIIIPAYNEPNISECLHSIKACKLPQQDVEIIILINHKDESPEFIKTQNTTTLKELSQINNLHAKIKIFPVLISDLPKKHAGAGLARKIAMDEAIQRFNAIGEEHGTIISLDADTMVSNNYLVEIENAFSNSKNVNCTIFNFAHRINEDKYGSKNTKAIRQYELYLRYYRLALKSTGFPYAYHTIGSCFAVSTEAYVKQGGMNRKQAGEDFYFLQKIFPLGKTIELKQVYVYPSSRPSERVPFGTGPAIKKIADEGGLLTYQWKAFRVISLFLAKLEQWHQCEIENIQNSYLNLPDEIQLFIPSEEWERNLKEIKINSTHLKSFTKRFFHWFNAFKIIKCLNYLHSSQYEKLTIEGEALKYLEGINYKQGDSDVLLEIFRRLEE